MNTYRGKHVSAASRRSSPSFRRGRHQMRNRHGRRWLKKLLAYLEANADLMLHYLEGLPIRACRPEASFLLWVDCSALKLDTAGLRALLAEAGITADPGHYYDTADIQGYTGSQHHFRLAFGMPRAQLEPTMERLRRTILKHF